MDELCIYVQDKLPWCVLSIDNIVLIDVTGKGVSSELEAWREMLDSKGLKISKSKTEFIGYRFSNTGKEDDQNNSYIERRSI